MVYFVRTCEGSLIECWTDPNVAERSAEEVSGYVTDESGDVVVDFRST